MKNKKCSVALGIFILALLFVGKVSAQTAAPASGSPASNLTIPSPPPLPPFNPENPPTTTDSPHNFLVATVNVYQPTIISQNDHSFKVSFQISNREQIQSDIHYGIQLVSDSDQLIVDQQAFDETLSLNTGQSVTREVSYQAPEYLSGKYTLFVVAGNSRGFIFSTFPAGHQVELNGVDFGLELKSCSVKVADDSQNITYTLAQGVDISSTENLIAHCDIVNHFSHDITFLTNYATYNRLYFFGKQISTQKDSKTLTLKTKEQKSFDFNLPIEKTSQAYDVGINLTDAGGNVISNRVFAHYVLSGESATIQNLRFDKDYYAKGDTANFSFLFSGSANNFVGARTTQDKFTGGNLQVTVENGDGTACASQLNRKLKPEDEFANLTFSVPITADCLNPDVKVVLADENGKTLDQQNFQAKTSEKTAEDKTTVNGWQKAIGKYVFYGVALLAILGLTVLFWKKRKGRSLPPAIFVIPFLLAGFFLFGAPSAKADSWSLWSTPGVGNSMYFSYGINKAVYYPGEQMTGSGTMGFVLNCGNYGTMGYAMDSYFQSVHLGYVSGVSAFILGKHIDFNATSPAGSVAGDYNATFSLAYSILYWNAQCFYFGGSYCHWTGWNYLSFKVPYQVVGTVPGAPSNLQAVSSQCGKIDLQWVSNSSTPEYFYIWRDGSYLYQVNGDTTTYTDIISGSHSYQVSAFFSNSDETSKSSSASAVAAVCTGAPTAPSNLQVLPFHCGNLLLQWNDNSSNETGFNIYRDGSLLTTVGANNRYYLDQGLSPGDTHSYQVSAYNGSGTSALSNLVSMAVPACSAPPPPDMAWATAGAFCGTIEVNLSYMFFDFPGFNIYRDGESVPIGHIDPGNSGPFIDYILGTHSYKVSAYNSGGESPLVSAGSATAAVCSSPPAAPSNLNTAAGAQCGTIVLNWRDNSNNENSFNIYRDGSLLTTVGANVITYTDSGMTGSHSYQVSAHNSAGESTRSNSSSATAVSCCIPDSNCSTHLPSWLGDCSGSCGGGIGSENGVCSDGCGGPGGTKSRACTNSTPCPSDKNWKEVGP
jgi:hypothetical protein